MLIEPYRLRASSSLVLIDTEIWHFTNREFYNGVASSHTGIAITLEGNLINGARGFPNTPYKGHCNEHLEQVSILLNNTINNVYIDFGCKR